MCFSQFLAHKFPYKNSLNVLWLLGYFYKTSLLVKTDVGTFSLTIGKSCATFDLNVWSHCLGYSTNMTFQNLTGLQLLAMRPP